jgi:hypothetical protein
MRLKPHRFGYKMWGDCLPSGYCVQFDLYQGKDTKMAGHPELGLGASVVLFFCEKMLLHIPSPYHYFFDNFFCGLPLLNELTKLSCGGTGTIRNHRTSNCPLPQPNAFGKEERGKFVTVKEMSGEMAIVRWHDNSVVTMASNCLDHQPLQMVSR